MTAEETIDAMYAKHDRVALLFSGGKDSLAVLELARPYLERTAVVWVDTGRQLPEIHALMDSLKEELPAFFIVNSDVAAQNDREGHPTDILPVWNTTLGRAVTGRQSLKLQSALDCCRANIWEPAHSFIKSLGVTASLRGQRADDHYKGPMRSGDVVDGVELVYPLQDWTRDDVLEFLAGRGYDEERLQLDHSSLDCWSCTAFADQTDRLAYLNKHYPDKAALVHTKLNQIRVVVQHDLDALTRNMEAANG